MLRYSRIAEQNVSRETAKRARDVWSLNLRRWRAHVRSTGEAKRKSERIKKIPIEWIGKGEAEPRSYNNDLEAVKEQRNEERATRERARRRSNETGFLPKLIHSRTSWLKHGSMLSRGSHNGPEAIGIELDLLIANNEGALIVRFRLWKSRERQKFSRFRFFDSSKDQKASRAIEYTKKSRRLRAILFGNHGNVLVYFFILKYLWKFSFLPNFVALIPVRSIPSIALITNDIKINEISSQN